MSLEDLVKKFDSDETETILVTLDTDQKQNQNGQSHLRTLQVSSDKKFMTDETFTNETFKETLLESDLKLIEKYEKAQSGDTLKFSPGVISL